MFTQLVVLISMYLNKFATNSFHESHIVHCVDLHLSRSWSAPRAAGSFFFVTINMCAELGLAPRAAGAFSHLTACVIPAGPFFVLDLHNPYDAHPSDFSIFCFFRLSSAFFGSQHLHHRRKRLTRHRHSDGFVSAPAARQALSLVSLTVLFSGESLLGSSRFA